MTNATLPKRTEPARLLFDPSKDTQHQYVPAAATDIRVRFEAFRAAQAKQQPQPLNVKTLRRNSK